MSSFNMRKILLNGISILSKYTNFIIVVALLILCQFTNISLWAESKSKLVTSLKGIIELALNINSKDPSNNNFYEACREKLGWSLDITAKKPQ